MARWVQFEITFEDEDEDSLTLTELQNYYENAIESEDYKSAGKFKKLIDEKIQCDEIEKVKYNNQPCFLDLDEISAFYQSEFDDGTNFVRLCLKGGQTVPVTISIEEFEKIFFNT
jgi:hypothetical protein